jgi:general secretion pathway protein E
MSETHPRPPADPDDDAPPTEELAPVAGLGAEIDVAADPHAEEVARRARLLPFPFARRFGVAIVDPCNGEGLTEVVHRSKATAEALLEVRRFAGRRLKLSQIDDEAFESVIASTYSRDSSEARQMVEDLGDEMDLASLAESVPETEDLLEQEDDAPIIRLINALLAEAVRENASDIHIETFEKELVVRFRVDGVLREIVQPKRALAPLLVSRIKVMAKLDIAEKRIPQDGRMSLRVAGREVDIRVSTMPSSSGERVVLRLLDKQAGRLHLDVLGMDRATLGRMRDVLAKPHGILLVTGPTGSGKTTTLYASMREIDSDSVNILTVEDPIEYNLPGIGQTQVNLKADMTFARGLRAILRQDPDVVMVGEIRDLETADIAVQASLTGHLVLSTLHTNTAVGAVTRLDDMGIEPFLLSSSLIGVLAQRLVRVLCPTCKVNYEADAAECEFLGIDAAQAPRIYRAEGCTDCSHSGYRGRTGIYELVIVDDEMRGLIHERVGEQQLTRHARRFTPSIREDGRHKVLSGITSVAEVLRVTRED